MRLVLYRHAKSDWSDLSLDDIDRPLNTRGQAAAGTMAAYVAGQPLCPDLILCSTSQRTRETLAYLLISLRQPCDIRLLREVYDKMDGDYISLIRQYGGQAKTLMVLGHNCATEETARLLIHTGAPADLTDMRQKYPTATLAAIDFTINDWADLEPGSGHLERFVKPSSLAQPHG